MKIVCWCIGLLSSFTSYAEVWHDVVACDIQFSIVNAGIHVEGKFNDVSTQIQFDSQQLASSFFSGKANVNSIQTGMTLRDRHLKEKSEFFDERRYPEIYLRSTHILPTTAQGRFSVDWMLQLKGQENSLHSEVQTYQVGLFGYAITTFTLQRHEWQLGGQSTSMADKVTISVKTLFSVSS
ncbi:MAG TPA: YceI family protein [Chitinophagaceae bacterium]|nr:YceI family protein [Chitinophagaceae bacterium]